MVEYTGQFLYALVFLLREEGGTNFDPTDRGGLTKFGISQKSYPDLDIANLTAEQATQLYYIDFWTKYGCQNYNLPIATTIFDCAVNCGPLNAVMWVQQSINKELDQIKVDGLMGPRTYAAICRADSYELACGVIGRRLNHYDRLISAYPQQRKFLRGWSARASRLLVYI